MVCFSTNRFLLCLGKSCLYPSAKIQNFIEIQSNIIELHPKSPILSSCDKGSLTFWDKCSISFLEQLKLITLASYPHIKQRVQKSFCLLGVQPTCYFICCSKSSVYKLRHVQSILLYSCHLLVFHKGNHKRQVSLPMVCHPSSLLARCLEPYFCTVRPNTIILCRQSVA